MRVLDHDALEPCPVQTLELIWLDFSISILPFR